MESMYVVFVVAILALIVVAKTAVVVPQQGAYVVETLGRYNRTIQAGFHILVPFIDRVAYKHNLNIRGHRRMQDSCEIEVTEQEPKIDSEVELCRVLVAKGANEVRDARDWTNPGVNEINKLGASHSGVCGSTLNADMRKLTEKVRSLGRE